MAVEHTIEHEPEHEAWKCVVDGYDRALAVAGLPPSVRLRLRRCRALAVLAGQAERHPAVQPRGRLRQAG